MDYAIIKLGNKQHRVRDGETLVVDRLPTDEGASFEPVVLLGEAKVTATIVEHGRGPKILIGKYRRRTGYKRHNGFRAATSLVEITIGAGGAKKAAAAKQAKPSTPRAEPEPQQAEALEVEGAEAVDTAAVDTAAVEEVDTEHSTEGLPDGYEGLTVAQIGAAAKDWSAEELASALVLRAGTRGAQGCNLRARVGDCEGGRRWRIRRVSARRRTGATRTRSISA